MSHEAHTACKCRSAVCLKDSIWMLSVWTGGPHPATSTTQPCSVVPHLEIEQRGWLFSIGYEIKVRFCCLINVLSVNLLVCHEIKINSDKAIKDYFGGGWCNDSKLVHSLREGAVPWAAGKRENTPFSTVISFVHLPVGFCQRLRHRWLGLPQCRSFIRLIWGLWELSFLEYFHNKGQLGELKSPLCCNLT